MPKRRMKRHSVTQPLDKPYRLIPLTQEQNAIVDAADFEWLSQYNWQAMWSPTTKSYYASRSYGGSMHRDILKCKPGEGDHKNHNTLDNRRSNLRRCTISQNSLHTKTPTTNTSGFKGVTFRKERSKWRARIRINGKLTHLGLFDSPEEAALVYDMAAKKFHKEFAFLNFPNIRPHRNCGS